MFLILKPPPFIKILLEEVMTPRTLEEIGEEFDLTRERIRQLEKLALCRLRHPSFGIREQDLV